MSRSFHAGESARDRAIDFTTAFIRSKGAIRAGESIRTQGALSAGTGYGIHAGLGIPFDAWETCAVVSAASRPDHLLSGLWCDPGALACEAPMEG